MRSRAPKGRCCSTELPRVDSTPVPWSRFLPWESLQLRCETQHALFENSIQAQTRAMHSMFASIIDIVEARLCGVRRERSNKLGPIDEMRSVRVRKSIYQSCVAHETRRRATLTRLDSVRRSRDSTSCDTHETRHRATLTRLDIDAVARRCETRLERATATQALPSCVRAIGRHGASHRLCTRRFAC